MTRRVSRRGFVAGVSGVAVLGGTTADVTAARRQTGGGDWPQHQRDAANLGAGDGLVGPQREPAIKWEYSTLGTGSTSNSPIVVDGTVYVGGIDSNVYALSLADGSLEWQATTNDSIECTPCYVDDVLVLGTEGDTDTMYGFDAATGDQLWQRQLDTGKLALTAADGRVYGSDGGNAYCVDPSNGSLVWSTGINGKCSVAVANGTAYVPGGGNNTVYALDAGTGIVEWESSLPEQLAEMGEPTVADGTLYVCGQEDSLYALDTDSGDVQWSFSAGTGIFSSPAVADGTVVFGNGTWNSPDDIIGSVFAVDAATGTQEWSYRLQRATFATASPVIADGVAYIADEDQTMYGFDVETGRPVWTRNYQSRTATGSALALADGQLVYFSEQGDVRVLEEPEATPTPTPTEGQDTGSTPSGGNYAPTARLTSSRTSVPLGAPIRFGAGDSRDQDGAIVSFEWNTDAQNSGDWEHTGPRIEHTYDEPGRYQVVVRVTDSDGATDTDSTFVSVTQGTATAQPIGPGGSTATPAERRRGFFTNGGGDQGVLGSAFNLTVVGFLLSVAGIVHQMLEGR